VLVFHQKVIEGKTGNMYMLINRFLKQWVVNTCRKVWSL